MTQIAIVVYPGFTALDFIGPYEVLRNLPDAEVRFVWHEPGPIAADSGVLLIGATHSFDETPSPDILLVPGGVTTFEHARDEKLLDWVRRAHQTATWTVSVCSGSVILAAGASDPMSPQADLRELRPDPVELSGLGHNAHVEDPARVWRLIASACRDAGVL